LACTRIEMSSVFRWVLRRGVYTMPKDGFGSGTAIAADFRGLSGASGDPPIPDTAQGNRMTRPCSGRLGGRGTILPPGPHKNGVAGGDT